MKKAGISVILFFFIAGLTAQDTASDTLHNVSVHKDPRLNALIKKNREVNEDVYLKTLRNIQGFRLQVINTNDRNTALSVKTRMLSDFPDEKTYFIYHSPYFKIQMGNFRTREDAEQLMQQVKKIYPSGVFIVPAKIEIRPSKDGELILDAIDNKP
ncbi:SPOR domain-containing protein [Agriterribacter sp.]|uniref:SPOR domain-containing protein n=1 Tax=Agriterribacter sp. TaxID=2821509 RepID=UPI002B81E78C|nr:SPOR domain-containing protein [Agriterribacter sp.]HTN08763.1 SPOR domain-containing protein [Agriterribacter sp.]